MSEKVFRPTNVDLEQPNPRTEEVRQELNELVGDFEVIKKDGLERMERLFFTSILVVTAIAVGGVIGFTIRFFLTLVS